MHRLALSEDTDCRDLLQIVHHSGKCTKCTQSGQRWKHMHLFRPEVEGTACALHHSSTCTHHQKWDSASAYLQKVIIKENEGKVVDLYISVYFKDCLVSCTVHVLDIWVGIHRVTWSDAQACNLIIFISGLRRCSKLLRKVCLSCLHASRWMTSIVNASDVKA